MLSDALKLIENGFSIIPVKNSKEPYFSLLPNKSWMEFKESPPSKFKVRSWFNKNLNDLALAVVCGPVSDNLECLDFDNHFGNAKDIFREFLKIVKSSNSELYDSLLFQSTQSGGYHVFYRCEFIEPNQKLAQDLNSNNKRETLIETRGEGGYVLFSPSNGYNIIHGSIESVPVISIDQRDFLIGVCKSFNRIAEEATPLNLKNNNNKNKPGDDFNEKADVLDILKSHGWTVLYESNGVARLRRPGKNDGALSATWNFIPNRLFVWSTNAHPFEAGKIYDPFAVFTFLECNGDFKSATKVLASKGYGESLNSDRKVSEPHERSTTKVDEQGNLKKSISINGVECADALSIMINATDFNVAMFLHDKYKDKIYFNTSSGKWGFWNGKKWVFNKQAHVTKMVSQHCLDIKNSILDFYGKSITQKLLDLANKMSSNSNVKSIVNFMQRLENFEMVAEDFDENPYFVNLNNGVFDLDSFKLNPDREFARRQRLTKFIDIDFNPKAKCTEWLKFMDFITCGDIGLQQFIQRALGMSLSGSAEENALFFLYGTGKNGKTVFITVIERVFQDYAMKSPNSIIEKKFGSDIPNDIARLKGARFVSLEELSNSKSLDEGKIKKITGNDTITARFLNQEFFDFTPTHTPWMFGNHKPRIKGADDGIWRRLFLIPFKAKVSKGQEIPQQKLVNSLLEEKEGILNWILNGWKEFCEGIADDEGVVYRGLRPPEVIIEARNEYRKAEDYIGQFLEDCSEENPTGSIKKTDLYKVYREFWCKENGYSRPLTKGIFIREVEDRGVKSEQRKNYFPFVGISLKKEYLEHLYPYGDGEGSIF